MAFREARSHRIFEVPELVGLMCKYSSNPQRARLARVSQSFFNITAPLIWERVEGAHKILKLLSATTVSIRPVERIPLRQNYTIMCFSPACYGFPMLDIDFIDNT